MTTCKACGREYRWIDAPDLCCPSCDHAPWEDAPAATRRTGGMGDLDRRLDDRLGQLDSRLDERMKDLDDRLDGRLGELDGRLHGDSRPGSRAGQRGLQGSAPVEASPDIRRFPPGFLPDGAEMEELRQLVFGSKHVRANEAYDDMAHSTRFKYFEDDPRFNAFAGRDAVGPRVMILGGLVREFAAMAIMSTFESRDTADGLLAYARQRAATAPGTPLATRPLRAQPTDEELARLHFARELMCAMVMWVIGHELGHICYSHIFGPDYEGQPDEVCKNQERDADSFASSVIASSSARQHWFHGQIKALATLALHEAHGVVIEFATHPTAKERLRNAVRSHPKEATELGLTEKMVEEMVPDPGSLADRED